MKPLLFIRPLLLLLAAAMASLCMSAANAADIDQTIVYIACSKGGSVISTGTGIVVSAQGHVLTARHVVIPPPGTSPDGITCTGSTGAAGSGKNLVFQQPMNLSVDALLLRFSDTHQPYEFMGFCALENWMIRRKIFVAGFPEGTETGVPSFREGVLSTVFQNAAGLLETDGQTVRGMSGGPVFSNNLGGIVGIVIGAEFTPQGTVRFYGILPVSLFAGQFSLTPSQVPCYRQSHEVDLSGVQPQWHAGDGPHKLGVKPEDGFCFIDSVEGQFNDAQDSVRVEIQDGEYALNGVNRQGGQHGASARCIWYDD